MSYLTDGPIDGAQLARHAMRSTDGAVVLFEGVVRDNNEGRAVESIFYDAYRPMAEKEIGKIVNDETSRSCVGGVSPTAERWAEPVASASVSSNATKRRR